MTEYLRLSLLNVRSLNTGRDELLVSIEKHSPDVLAINETWIREGDDISLLQIPGYIFKHIPRSTGKRGGGVGFYIKKKIKTHIIQHPKTSLEQMWIELQHKGLRLAIGTVYRPETQNIGNSIEELSETLSSLSAYSFQCLLTDFNIDLLNSSSNDTKEFLRSLDQQNYTQLVQEPTRITMTSATLLDLIITDTPMLCTKIEVIHNPCLSDHALILADFDIKKQKDGVKSITKRCFNDIDEEEFGEDLRNISWNKIKESESINDMVAKFNCEILNLFDKHAPVKVIKIKNNSYPWITEVIKIMMEKRDEALKKAHNSKNDASWSYYKMFKNFTNASIKREKKAYINFYVNKNANRPILMWQHFKKISPLGKGNSGCIPPHLQEPDKINDFFMTLPGNEITNLKTLAQFTTNRDSNTEFFIKECSKEQVLNIINNISSNAIGHDNISITMIKLTLPVTLDIITYIINQSIKTHTFPDSWKIAKVIPLPKITSVENYKDLRPISILPVMSKIIEKIVCMQLTTYLETHNILPEHQSGFRKAHGTAAALSAVTDDILSASDNGNGSILVLLDFSRAFDCINIELMLAKLYYYGISLLVNGSCLF